MKYCQPTTQAHPLAERYPQYLNNINTIIREEGGTNRPFNTEVALKLDKIKECSDDINITHMKSMDMVLGIKDGTNSLSLLVEFKLDCKNARNLKEGELREKIKDSKILLFGSGIPVHNRYVFIFNDELLENESRRIISYKLTNANGEPLSIDEFRAKY